MSDVGGGSGLWCSFVAVDWLGCAFDVHGMNVAGASGMRLILDLRWWERLWCWLMQPVYRRRFRAFMKRHGPPGASGMSDFVSIWDNEGQQLFIDHKRILAVHDRCVEGIHAGCVVVMETNADIQLPGLSATKFVGWLGEQIGASP